MVPLPEEEWYYHKDEVTHGPLSFKGLRQLAAAGLLGPEDSVWSAEREKWVPASALPRLFARKKKTTARPARAGTPEPAPSSVWSWANRLLWSLLPVLCMVAWYGGKEAGYREGEHAGYDRGKAEGQAQGSTEGFQRGIECSARLRASQDGKGGLPMSRQEGEK